MSVAVNEKRCPQNHKCPAVAVCPAGALAQEGFGAPKVNGEACTSCGKCVRRCPMGALALDKNR
jgi:ferredoxin